MSQPITAIMIGAGNRGYEAYGPYALENPNEIRFVAVAEPHDARRARFAQDHAISPERQFHTWEELAALGKIADAALICTMDRMHIEPAITAMEAGYDVLLEKPMATTQADCVQLVQTAERTGRLLQICHVLRYTAFFSTLYDIITSGRLGDIITFEHRENVSYWHMAHSFVRGNWRNSKIESPMILAKCCHDLDILYWNLGPCAQLDSFGSLIHYREENAPKGAPMRCSDGCPAADDCLWYAPNLYLHNYTGWPVSVISEDTSMEARQRALETGPYGRCVYHCDNDVVDNQTVNMQFESGVTGALFMHGHSHEETRTMRYDGTRATLRGIFSGTKNSIEVHDHLTGRVEKIDLARGIAGHGGGDSGIMTAFIKALRDPDTALTTARESLESHLMAFAAEQARVDNIIISMDKFRRRAETVT